jgi:hypothetical protein
MHRSKRDVSSVAFSIRLRPAQVDDAQRIASAFPATISHSRVDAGSRFRRCRQTVTTFSDISRG